MKAGRPSRRRGAGGGRLKGTAGPNRPPPEGLATMTGLCAIWTAPWPCSATCRPRCGPCLRRWWLTWLPPGPVRRRRRSRRRLHATPADTSCRPPSAARAAWPAARGTAAPATHGSRARPRCWACASLCGCVSQTQYETAHSPCRQGGAGSLGRRWRLRAGRRAHVPGRPDGLGCLGACRVKKSLLARVNTVKRVVEGGVSLNRELGYCGVSHRA